MNADAARRLALALPGAVELPHHHLTSFRVNGKIFATMTPDGAELRVFIQGEDARDAWLQREPEALSPLFWGGKRVGLGVALAKARASWVKALLTEAWQPRAGA